MLYELSFILLYFFWSKMVVESPVAWRVWPFLRSHKYSKNLLLGQNARWNPDSIRVRSGSKIIPFEVMDQISLPYGRRENLGVCGWVFECSHAFKCINKKTITWEIIWVVEEEKSTLSHTRVLVIMLVVNRLEENRECWKKVKIKGNSELWWYSVN